MLSSGPFINLFFKRPLLELHASMDMFSFLPVWCENAAFRVLKKAAVDQMPGAWGSSFGEFAPRALRYTRPSFHD